MQRALERIEGELGCGRARHPPGHDATREKTPMTDPA